MADQNRQRQQIVQGIAKGERAFREGRTITLEEARKKLSKWLGDGQTEVS